MTLRPTNRRLTAALSVAALIAILGCGPRGQETPQKVSLRAELEERIPGWMDVAGIPGLSIAVIEDGAITWTGDFGVDNLETGREVTAATVFEAASLSKPVFAYMVQRMVERGELDLDRPLHELLEYERFAGDPRGLALTPRLVLSHQTGLPNWGGDPLEFQADPGERFGYSGEGYLYLQRALETLTGFELQELARTEVFEPLEMPESRFTWSEGAEFALAIGHDEAGEPQRRNVPEPNAAGSLHTTAEEYARFLVALLEPRGLEPESVEAALREQVSIRGDERGPDRVVDFEGRLGWGLGWGLWDGERGPIAWHWGDNGVFHAFVAILPEQRSGVVYFANSSNGLSVAEELVGSVVGEMAGLFEWLGYAQTSEPGWTARREGFLAERRGDFLAAIGHFRRAIEVAPDDASTAERIEWIEELLSVEERPREVPSEVLASYVGGYGPRRLFLEEGELTYQREGRDPYRLIPLDVETFALDGMVDFRIRVVTDEAGRPTKLVGLYVGGGSDESPRDTDSQ